MAEAFIIQKIGNPLFFYNKSRGKLQNSKSKIKFRIHHTTPFYPKEKTIHYCDVQNMCQE